MKKYFLLVGVAVFLMSGCGETKFVPEDSTVTGKPNVTVLPEETVLYSNSEYKFSLEYPKSWNVEKAADASSSYGPFFEAGYSFSLTDISTLRPNADIPGLDIAITKKSFQDIVKMIEDIDRLPNGETVSKVGDVEDVIIDNVAAKKGSNGTGIGLPESFYFIPLPNQNKSLWITYNSFETSTIDTVETIVSSLKLK